jgi:hypothetical protein
MTEHWNKLYLLLREKLEQNINNHITKKFGNDFIGLKTLADLFLHQQSLTVALLSIRR